ncbi:MAG: SEC-C domain-containing protein [Chloroflexi bacterium]|nr:SEC-C domain-containing protein [Chloroflexota bacterium]
MSNNRAGKTPSITNLLGQAASSIVFIFFLLILLALAVLVLGFAATLVGRVISLGSGLSLFEATMVAIAVGIATVYFIIDKTRPRYPWDVIADEEDEDFEDEKDEEDAPLNQVSRIKPPPSRNDPCPCGSGKKFKYCHGR